MKKRFLSVLLVSSMAVSSAAWAGETTADAQEAAEAGHYTFAYADAASSTWSPTDWETSDEGSVLDLVTTGLYGFNMGEDGTGYTVVPEAAAALPEDVTAEFAGNETYGVPEDATEGYAWRIALNEAACWEDGTPITSADYIYSMQQFLNPEMSNYRASSYYTGQFALANAYDYYNSAKAGEVGYSSTLGDLGFATVEEAQAEGYTEFGVDMAGFWNISEAGTVSITDETEYRDETVEEGQDEDYVSGKYLYETYLAPGTPYETYAADYIYVGEVIKGASWDEVGLIADDDYTITFVLQSPTVEFYVEYNLGTGFLLYEEKYEANKQQTGDVVKSSYNTSVESSFSYGPYKVTEFQADKYMKLTKNENWWGYTDGNHEGMYQTTDIDIEYIDEHTTEMSLFLQGKLSEIGLTSTDIDQYGNSDYLYYVPQTYTSKLSFNGDLESLKKEDGDGVNHSILSIKDFRHAISLSLDRDAFCATCTAGHEAGYGIINYAYTANPDTGELYRDSEPAQQTLCEFYGADDISQITGYDKDAAAALFQSAYEQAIADGLMTESDRVQIDLHLYGSDEGYVRIVNFLQDAVDAATVGTGLEGKVTVNLVADENYYDNMKAGLVDCAITTWGGSSMDVYGMTECYNTENMKNEYSFDPMNETCTINVNGEDITKTYYEWHVALNEGEYKMADYDTKNQILAGVELGWLNTYLMIPVYYRNNAVLYSQRTVLGSEYYLNSILEYGGLKYMTYTMDDAEWDAYCAENNYQLTY